MVLEGCRKASTSSSSILCCLLHPSTLSTTRKWRWLWVCGILLCRWIASVLHKNLRYLIHVSKTADMFVIFIDHLFFFMFINNILSCWSGSWCNTFSWCSWLVFKFLGFLGENDIIYHAFNIGIWLGDFNFFGHPILSLFATNYLVPFFTSAWLLLTSALWSRMANWVWAQLQLYGGPGGLWPPQMQVFQNGCKVSPSKS